MAQNIVDSQVHQPHPRHAAVNGVCLGSTVMETVLGGSSVADYQQHSSSGKPNACRDSQSETDHDHVSSVIGAVVERECHVPTKPSPSSSSSDVTGAACNLDNNSSKVAHVSSTASVVQSTGKARVLPPVNSNMRQQFVRVDTPEVIARLAPTQAAQHRLASSSRQLPPPSTASSTQAETVMHRLTLEGDLSRGISVFSQPIAKTGNVDLGLGASNSIPQPQSYVFLRSGPSVNLQFTPLVHQHSSAQLESPANPGSVGGTVQQVVYHSSTSPSTSAVLVTSAAGGQQLVPATVHISANPQQAILPTFVTRFPSSSTDVIYPLAGCIEGVRPILAQINNPLQNQPHQAAISLALPSPYRGVSSQDTRQLYNAHVGNLPPLRVPILERSPPVFSTEMGATVRVPDQIIRQTALPLSLCVHNPNNSIANRTLSNVQFAKYPTNSSPVRQTQVLVPNSSIPDSPASPSAGPVNCVSTPQSSSAPPNQLPESCRLVVEDPCPSGSQAKASFSTYRCSNCCLRKRYVNPCSEDQISCENCNRLCPLPGPGTMRLESSDPEQSADSNDSTSTRQSVSSLPISSLGGAFFRDNIVRGGPDGQQNFVLNRIAATKMSPSVSVHISSSVNSCGNSPVRTSGLKRSLDPSISSAESGTHVKKKKVPKAVPEEIVLSSDEEDDGSVDHDGSDDSDSTTGSSADRASPGTPDAQSGGVPGSEIPRPIGVLGRDSSKSDPVENNELPVDCVTSSAVGSLDKSVTSDSSPSFGAILQPTSCFKYRGFASENTLPSDFINAQISESALAKPGIPGQHNPEIITAEPSVVETVGNFIPSEAGSLLEAGTAAHVSNFIASSGLVDYSDSGSDAASPRSSAECGTETIMPPGVDKRPNVDNSLSVRSAPLVKPDGGLDSTIAVDDERNILPMNQSCDVLNGNNKMDATDSDGLPSDGNNKICSSEQPVCSESVEVVEAPSGGVKCSVSDSINQNLLPSSVENAPSPLFKIPVRRFLLGDCPCHISSFLISANVVQVELYSSMANSAEVKIVRLQWSPSAFISFKFLIAKEFGIIWWQFSSELCAQMRQQLGLAETPMADQPYFDIQSTVFLQRYATLILDTTAPTYELVRSHLLHIKQAVRVLFPEVSLLESDYKESRAMKELVDKCLSENPINLNCPATQPIVTAPAIAQQLLESSATLFKYPPPPSKNGIEVTTEDALCLADDEFLNDTIIDFYLRHFVNEKLSSDMQEKVYIFNTFFWKRLSQKFQDDSKSSSSGDASTGSQNTDKIRAMMESHARVKKWTKNVDIFTKDFIVVPINQEYHWYVAVICFPGMASPARKQPATSNKSGKKASKDGPPPDPGGSNTSPSNPCSSNFEGYPVDPSQSERRNSEQSSDDRLAAVLDHAFGSTDDSNDSTSNSNYNNCTNDGNVFDNCATNVTVPTLAAAKLQPKGEVVSNRAGAAGCAGTSADGSGVGRTNATINCTPSPSDLSSHSSNSPTIASARVVMGKHGKANVPLVSPEKAARIACLISMDNPLQLHSKVTLNIDSSAVKPISGDITANSLLDPVTISTTIDSESSDKGSSDAISCETTLSSKMANRVDESSNISDEFDGFDISELESGPWSPIKPLVRPLIGPTVCSIIKTEVATTAFTDSCINSISTAPSVSEDPKLPTIERSLSSTADTSADLCASSQSGGHADVPPVTAVNCDMARTDAPETPATDCPDELAVTLSSQASSEGQPNNTLEGNIEAGDSSSQSVTSQESSQSKEATESKQRPCIVVFDSLWQTTTDKNGVIKRDKARHYQMVSALRNYLTAEWKQKRDTERIFDRVEIIAEYPIVPQQQNASDCGLYLLEYVEQFITNPTGYFLNRRNLSHWFPLNKVSYKRNQIFTLINQLREEWAKDADKRRKSSKKTKKCLSK